MRRLSPAVFRSKELDELVRDGRLGRKELKWIRDMEFVLKENIFTGESVKKGQIPPHYVKQYGVNDLFRYQHPKGYRSCYTLLNKGDLGVCPVILDLMSHSSYDRVFGYR